MIEDISLSDSILVTPNVSLYSVNDQSNTTNNESTSVPHTCTSGYSCIFHTPDASLNSDFKSITPPTIFDLDSSGKNMAYSSRKFCQTTHSSQNKILSQESESADKSFHTPMGLDSPSHIRRYLRAPADAVLRCNKCSNTYRTKNRYENHLSRHYTGLNIWSCESCNFTFHSRRTFKFHTITTHNYKPLRRSNRNIRMIATNTGLPNKVKHSLRKRNKLTPKRFNKSRNESCLHLVEEKNISFQVEDSFSRIPINATSTPLLPKDKKYAKDKISTENAFSDGRHNRVKQNLEQGPKLFKCDQCTKRCSTLRALNIHKFMHRRPAMDSSSDDVTSSLASESASDLGQNFSMQVV